MKNICKYCKKEYIHSPSRNKYFCSIGCYGNWHVGINSTTYGKSFVKGKHWKWNDESKKKLIIWNKGKKLTEEHKRKIKENTSIIIKKQFENGRKLSIKTLNALKEGRKKANKFTSENNPMKNPFLKEKMRQSLISLYQKYPEKHINRILAKNNRLSKPQMLLYNYLLLYYPDAQLNYRLKTRNGNKFLDVGIPSIKTCYEYDSEYWHQNRKEYDKQRNIDINFEGWNVIHINQKDLEVILSKTLISPLNKIIVCR